MSLPHWKIGHLVLEFVAPAARMNPQVGAPGPWDRGYYSCGSFFSPSVKNTSEAGGEIEPAEALSGTY